MIYYKNIFKFLSIFIFLFFSFFLVNASVFNQGGDFEVISDSQKLKIFNDDIKAVLKFEVKNNEDSIQIVDLILPQVNGWDVVFSSNKLILDAGETQEVVITLVANSDFDYETSVTGPNEFKITQKKNYKGFFNFPLQVIGDAEKVSLNFEVEIDSPNRPLSYEALFASKVISPEFDLKYSIKGINVDKSQNVDILIEIGDSKIASFEEVFTKENSYKIFSNKISSDFKPGNYPVKITIRYFEKDANSATEWYSEDNLDIVAYDELKINSIVDSSILDDVYTFKITNVGNVDSTYEKVINVSFLESFFFSTDYEYKSVGDSIIFSIPVIKGESSDLSYNYNYTYLYLFLIFLIGLVGFIYHKENSIPIKVQTKLYGVHRDVHEGVKSFKVRLGFDSIKSEELEDIKLVFKMPSYLAVKEGSFLLSEPNQVLKGSNQYKLVWNFHNFEKGDSRILGFTLENKRGILGDIQVDELEFEIKMNGKVKKYLYSLPVIKG